MVDSYDVVVGKCTLDWHDDMLSIIGQRKLRERVSELASDGRLPHVLLCGPPEMGKKTIASAVASELCPNPQVLDPLAVKNKLDLAGVLTNVEPNGIILIGSVDAFPEFATRILVEAMSDFRMTILIGDRPHIISLPLFSVIGTTERVWQLDKSMLRLFVIEDLEPYSQSELSELIRLVAVRYGFSFLPDAASELALHAKGSPGYAEVLVKRVYSQLRTKEIDLPELRRVLDRLGLSHPAPSLDLAARLSVMSGVEFEDWVAEYFRNRGYAVEPTPATGDHGIDLILRKDSAVFGVQCKRWNDAIGEPVLRDFYGSVSNGSFVGGFVVTTSSFTDPARLFAEGKPITLVGLADLIQTTLFSERPL